MTARQATWTVPLITVAALATGAAAWAPRGPDVPHVIMFKGAYCVCCNSWASLLPDEGFTLEVRVPEDLSAVFAKHGVPSQLTSCHVALVDGYVVVGHVPIAAIQRLLRERPHVAGISVPGMLAGSPGMDSPGVGPSHYDVLAFGHDGETSVYARY